ncbi:hypothetical protein [Georgenia faecalis]|uniref:Excreted virulence factor EspC (Type VII ESX diderm) n=1 Tax=Georgenia faecalis TaxID=2483799 RepID=A0ABV9DA13_9MICO|nr:hypothetical protein [Georgenia faecalis]
MPSYDFAVDLPTLARAAQGAAETVQLFKDDDVNDLMPAKGDLGSDAVASAVDEFTGRWERGMNNLVKDIEELAGRMGKVAMNYADLDRSGHEAMTAVAARVRGVRVGGR